MKMKKRILALLVMSLFAISYAFSMSIVYKDTPQGYDSDVLLNQFGGIYDEKESANRLEDKVKDIGIMFWGPGAYPHLYYGHVGLVVEFENGRNILYDYGVFNPSQKGFVKEVIHGRMFYELAATPINVDYMFAISENSRRALRYYRLNGLNDEKKTYIASFLSFNYSIDRQKYLYNFFSDNCSTRVRDILDIAYDGALSRLGERYYGTRRMAIEEQTEPHIAVEIVYGIAEGYLQDEPITYYDAMFLPSYLETALQELQVLDIKNEDQNSESSEESIDEFISASTLVRESTWTDAWPYYTSFNTHNSNWFPLILIAIILAVLNVARTILTNFVNNKVAIRIVNKVYAFINAFVLLFVFILSLAMLFLQFYTLIDCGWKNENSIFVSPLVIFIVFYAFKALFIPSYEKEQKAIKKMAGWATVMFILTLIALILKLVLPHQANMLHIISFGIYYLSLMQIDRNSFQKVKKFFTKKRSKNESNT